MGIPPEGKKPSELATYADLFDRMVDPAFLINKESYVIEEANPACDLVLGIVPEKLVGQNVLELVPPDLKDAFEKSLRIAKRRYYPRSYDSMFLTSDGRVIDVNVMACTLKYFEDEEIIQIVAKDVTPEREAQRNAERYLKELEAANEKLEAISITDEMTGLPNFRHFSEVLEKEHERATRYRSPYSLIFCDVDFFKKFNDQFGHQAGDEVLRQVGTLLKKYSRNTDLPARYGGEEFVVLCPGVKWDGAKVLAERIRLGVEKHSFLDQEGNKLPRVTISLGVASFPPDGDSVDRLIKMADEALYHSKHNGRNQVSSAVEIAESKKKLKKAS